MVPNLLDLFVLISVRSTRSLRPFPSLLRVLKQNEWVNFLNVILYIRYSVNKVRPSTGDYRFISRVTFIRGVLVNQ